MSHQAAPHEALLRALCFHDTWGYPPTLVEWVASSDVGPHGGSLDEAATWREALSIVNSGEVLGWHGRVCLVGRQNLITEHEQRVFLFARKWRRLRHVMQWLVRVGGMKAVFLCNTTALAHARDASDLDLFIITEPGSLWQCRAWSTLPFLLLKQRPGESALDPICLSFFIDTQAMDLSKLAIERDDPYLRHWFLSLVPLLDDGISVALWHANQALRRRHPLARQWILHGEARSSLPFLRVPTHHGLESWSAKWQKRRLPNTLTALQNQGTAVVIDEHVLKFHGDDAREAFRKDYVQRCHGLSLAP